VHKRVRETMASQSKTKSGRRPGRKRTQATHMPATFVRESPRFRRGKSSEAAFKTSSELQSINVVMKDMKTKQQSNGRAQIMFSKLVPQVTRPPVASKAPRAVKFQPNDVAVKDMET
jgi:hypothetical protein